MAVKSVYKKKCDDFYIEVLQRVDAAYVIAPFQAFILISNGTSEIVYRTGGAQKYIIDAILEGFIMLPHVQRLP